MDAAANAVYAETTDIVIPEDHIWFDILMYNVCNMYIWCFQMLKSGLFLSSKQASTASYALCWNEPSRGHS